MPENVLLREWSPNDIDALVQNANEFEVAKQLRNSFPHPYTEDDGKAFLDMCRHRDKAKNLLLAITVNNVPVGGIGLLLQDDIGSKSAELGYWIGKDHWGQGIATEAIRQIVSLGFETFDIVRIFVCVFENNWVSQKVLEKNGFEFEGRLRKSVYKNGHLQNAFIYAIIKDGA